MGNSSDAIIAKEWLSALVQISPQFQKIEPLLKLIARDYGDAGPAGFGAAMPFLATAATSKEKGTPITPGQMLQIDKMSEKELLNLKNFITKLLEDVNSRMETTK